MTWWAKLLEVLRIVEAQPAPSALPPDAERELGRWREGAWVSCGHCGREQSWHERWPVCAFCGYDNASAAPHIDNNGTI